MTKHKRARKEKKSHSGVPVQPQQASSAKLNKPTKQLSLADKIRLTKSISKTYSEGQYTLSSCCDAHGINVRTFNEWTRNNSEVAEIYAAAKKAERKVFRERLCAKAKQAFERLVEGYEYEETQQEGIPNPRHEQDATQPAVLITKIKRERKHVAPNASIVRFALLNLTEGEFVDEKQIKLTHTDNPLAPFFPGAEALEKYNEAVRQFAVAIGQPNGNSDFAD